MSKDFGSIEYNENEFLNVGQDYLETDKKILDGAELHIIDEAETIENENEEDDEEVLEKAEIEARLVAKRIKELINSNYCVFDKKRGYRSLEFKDIVILLRKTTGIAPIYEKELTDLGYPVFSDIGTNYFESNRNTNNNEFT